MQCVYSSNGMGSMYTHWCNNLTNTVVQTAQYDFHNNPPWSALPDHKSAVFYPHFHMQEATMPHDGKDLCEALLSQ